MGKRRSTPPQISLPGVVRRLGLGPAVLATAVATTGLTDGQHLGAHAAAPAGQWAASGASDGSDTPQRRVTATSRPNVVLMVVDDATVEDIKYMPNVQSLLVDHGTTFTRNYSPYPLCCPARATILTGQYSHNHRVLGNLPPLGGAPAFDPSHTIATYLDDDYRTAMIGKYLNGFNTLTVPPGWDTFLTPIRATIYNYLDQAMNSNGSLQRFDNLYSTTNYNDQALGFITSSQRPFFLDLSWVAPHNGSPLDTPTDPGGPYVAEPYRDTYDGPPLPDDPSFNEADISDKRPSFQGHGSLSADRIAVIEDVLAQRREALRFVDDGVLSIVQAIADKGQLGKTFFIFVSDNGWLQGQHRIATGKSSAYEPSSHVPLIIRGPGIPAGVEFDGLSGLQDLTPTILDMTDEWAGKASTLIDGMSLLPLLEGTRTTDRPQVLEVATNAALTDQRADRLALRWHGKARVTSVDWYMRGIVTADGWKYTEYPRTSEVEMYDLNSDPYEEHNLAGELLHGKQQASLRALLRQYRSCKGLGCR
ncbi:MAG TPA: sulfatase [Nocardioidaceae bacterium]